MNAKIFVISGPSGVGKSTIVKEIISRRDDIRLSISVTTRPPRKGEQEGKDYFFVSKKKFQEMINKGELLEYAEVFSNYYGTPAYFVDETLRKGFHVILEIDVEGALKVKQKRPDAILIFINCKSIDTIRSRLLKRATEDINQIQIRLERIKKELKASQYYDYIVYNEDLEKCIEEINKIINKNSK